MNLFTNPSALQLRALITKAERKHFIHDVHDVVVDFDGEVLIDPQLRQPGLDLNKFKVHFRLNEQTGTALHLGRTRLKDLFNSLLDDWKAQYDSISFFVFNCGPGE